MEAETTPAEQKARVVDAEHEDSEHDAGTLADLQRPSISFRNFKTACEHYQFPGNHQTGSYGPKGGGVVRTYSNGLPFKDKLLEGGRLFLYRLKNDKLRAQFQLNSDLEQPVRVFRKQASRAVLDLGLYRVDGFENAGAHDHVLEFGKEFVRFVREDGHDDGSGEGGS